METCEFETIKFNSMAEIIAWIRENTAMTVIPKTEAAAAHKDATLFLNTADGKKALRANHFFYVKEIRQRIAGAFNKGFECDRCRYEGSDGDRCGVCNVVQNIINAM